MTRDLRVGMLGAGFIGSFHSYALSLQRLIRTPPSAAIQLAVLADLNEAARTAVQNRFGWQRAVSSWEDVVGDPDLDIFVNAGPNVLHHAPVLAALASGKHIFCEKPLAMDAGEALAMWKAAEARKARTGALVYVGDAVEERVDPLCARAGELALLGLKCFMFHEGHDRGAEGCFREIARLTGGAYAAFDSAAPGRLGSLLAAAAAYAAGGTPALEAQGRAGDAGAAQTLLSQIR